MKENFVYNPFSGVLHEDLEQVVIPRIDIPLIENKIANAHSLAIEFIGKQGRGKTTHLRYLQKRMPQYPIFNLQGKFAVSKIMNHPSDTVFIDSIHHLSLLDRITLFKHKKTVIYTTHWSRKLECIFSKKKHYAINFKGIDTSLLQQILNKRLALASNSQVSEDDLFSEKQVTLLIKKFGDDYRGIINHLYEQY